MDSKEKRERVAVLGLGLTGVGTLKNLLEAGLEAVAFERNDYVGGLWQWNADTTQTTVTKTTMTNISKQRSCYQDFPFADDVPDHPSADQVTQYIQDYAKHFKLMKHCRLGIKIKLLQRSADGKQWTLELLDKNGMTSIENFDKVVCTTGTFQQAYTPTIEGSQNFRGQLLHSQAYKDPQHFAGKRVVIVGLSNTAADIAVELSSHAGKLYVSHRSGARIMPRRMQGRPVDHKGTRRLGGILLLVNSLMPVLASKIGAYYVDSNMQKTFPSMHAKEWGLLPAPPIFNAPPMINDHLVDQLASDMVTSVAGVKRFLDNGTSIELIDGTILPDIDAIIFATGYYFDYSFLHPSINPTAFPTPEWDTSPHANGLQYARLYRGILHPSYPSSLAFIGPYRGHSASAFGNADLSSQAIAQVFAGKYPVPGKQEMEQWCDENYRMALSQIKAWRIGKIGSDPKRLERWLNEVAGNGVTEYLGWGLKGWKFWFEERELCGLIMNGIDTPYIYRLFDGRPGGRKKWDGAREAIYKVNGRKMK